MKNLIGLITVVLFIAIFTFPFTEFEQNEGDFSWFEGTWTIVNRTVEEYYSGFLGQVTITKDRMILDSGRFAAAGLIHNSETPFYKNSVPIKYRFISSQYIYVTWNQISPSGEILKTDAMLTVVKRKEKRITLIGQGGVGSIGCPRISILQKVF